MARLVRVEIVVIQRCERARIVGGEGGRARTVRWRTDNVPTTAAWGKVRRHRQRAVVARTWQRGTGAGVYTGGVLSERVVKQFFDFLNCSLNVL